VKRARAPSKRAKPLRTPGAAATADLLFEIGVEELPASYILPALEQLDRGASAGLADLRLAFAGLETWATPRRLVLFVRGVAARQRDHREEVQGPAVRVAFDELGNPTRALLGFCQGKGVDPTAVRRVQTPKGEYVAVTLEHKGRPALEVLAPLLATLATRLQFPKAMRWITGDDTRFARPVRWMTALLGARVVPVRAFGLVAGRVSQGHRFLHGKAVAIRSAAGYRAALRRASVLVDHRERAAHLARQLEQAARAAGGKAVATPSWSRSTTSWSSGRPPAAALSIPASSICRAR